MKQPIVSIIIPAYNEELVIGRLLQSIKKQTYKNVEVIVVDDASTDKTAQVSKKYTKNVYTRPHKERSIQRNFGASKSKGKYLLFLDADMKLSPKVVRKCVDIFQNDKKVGAITVLEKSIAKTFWEKVKAHERSFYNLEGDTTTDAARFFPRGIFKKIKGYDKNITGPEDWDITDKVIKRGYKIQICKELIYHYERVPNPYKLAKKKYYYAIKSHRYLKKHNVNLVSAKTIYFLRPVFYKNWRKLLSQPVLSAAMIGMLTCEQLGGALGYVSGKVKNA